MKINCDKCKEEHNHNTMVLMCKPCFKKIVTNNTTYIYKENKLLKGKLSQLKLKLLKEERLNILLKQKLNED